MIRPSRVVTASHRIAASIIRHKDLGRAVSRLARLHAAIVGKETPIHEAYKMADDVIRTLRQYTQQGLPDAYGTDFKSYLMDFYADLPLDEQGAGIAFDYILKEYKNELNAAKEKFGFDLETDLERAKKEVGLVSKIQ